MSYTYTKEDAAIYEDENTQLSEKGAQKLMADIKADEEFRKLHGISRTTYEELSEEGKESFWDDLDVSSRESFLRFISKFSSGFKVLNGADYLMLKFDSKSDFRKFFQKILYTITGAEMDDEFIVAKRGQWVLDYAFDGMEEMLISEYGEVYLPIKGLATQGFLK